MYNLLSRRRIKRSRLSGTFDFAEITQAHCDRVLAERWRASFEAVALSRQPTTPVVHHGLMAPTVVENGTAQTPLVFVEILDRVSQYSSAFEFCRCHQSLKILPRKEQLHEKGSPRMCCPITASVLAV
jgi:hypothetical protein